MIGERLGKYTILQTLGTGSMGTVYKAEDPDQRRPVAVRLVRSHVLFDAERRERFLQQMLLASEIRHPALCPILEIGDENDDFFVVTPYIGGRTLARYTEAKPLPWRTSINVAVAVAEGLSAVHAAGAVHRAVKPSNIWVNEDGSILLSDCCVARFTEIVRPIRRGPHRARVDFADTLIPLGALSYMSPEQVRGTAVGHRSDIFSLGAVLYELLTGKHPFEARNSLSRMSAILEGQPPAASARVPGVPFELDRILRKALEKSPEDRFATMDDFAAALRAVYRNPGLFLPPAAPHRPDFPIAGWTVGVLLFLILIAAGFYYFYSG
jgi:serine/threonine-protein kinase